MKDDIEYWKNRAALLEERLWRLESRCLKEADKALNRPQAWPVRLVQAWWRILKEWVGCR